MTDLTPTIQVRSDQLNADDLISGPITIRITQVSLASDAAQPVKIRYENDNGKPYIPCKSMRRLLVALWGSDGSKYIGKSLTLFRDPTVKWAGQEVGGIRISHMSDIDKEESLSLTVTRGKKSPYTVQPLMQDQQQAGLSLEEWKDLESLVVNAQSLEDLDVASKKAMSLKSRMSNDDTLVLRDLFSKRREELKNKTEGF